MAEKREIEQRGRTANQGLERRPGRGGQPQRGGDPFAAFGAGPFGLMRRMQEDMDRVFGRLGMGRWPSLWGDQAEWSPAIDVFQRGDELVVRVDLPGLSRDDLTVEVGEDSLTISGERRSEHEERQEGMFTSERAYGSFCRVIPLPEGAVTDDVRASFQDGVLEVRVPTPPQEVRRGRRIEIEQGARPGEQRPRSEQKK